MASSARVAALRFLKIRPRSIAELKGKLKTKGFSFDEIEAAVVYLMDIGLLDDRAFTKSWIAYRLARPFGFRRICAELQQKGVAKDIIEEAITEAKGEYAEDKTVLDLALRRWERLSGIDPQKKKKRVFDFLVRRGYSMDAVIKVIKKLK